MYGTILISMMSALLAIAYTLLQAWMVEMDDDQSLSAKISWGP
ncbi:hypothetical protein C7476_12912 [Phyllobacterium bourgognense]|uniref:Uncharacterized protein n=1 Tax=Phyllobacterium bourgognense TaxID=314236 RepID=A0A368YIZ0_9HYPH|nr:hypothetical protein C7476_12912 [Phyllobacterium bourgognense]